MKTVSLLCALVGGCALAPVPGRAVLLDASFEAQLAVTSANVWRGRILNDEPCVQPCVTAKARGFTFDAWGTWDLTDVSNSWENTRMDIALGWAREFPRHLVGAGAVAYVYRDDMQGRSKDTFEAYARYVLDVVTLPSLTVCYDFGDIGGLYGTVALAHSLAVPRGAVDLRVAVGFADEGYVVGWFSRADNEREGGIEAILHGESGLVDATASVAVPLAIAPRCTLTPRLDYMCLINGAIGDALDSVGADDRGFTWGLTLGVEF